MESLIRPYWSGNEMFRESILPLAEMSGAVLPIPLLYPATEILEVRSATLQVLYEEGRDYVLENGMLLIPETSHIPYMSQKDYYLDHAEEGASFGRTGGGFIRFGEGTYFHERQAVVTYRHNGKWPGEIPGTKMHLLPKTAEYFSGRRDMRVLFFGDSITTGANSSGITGIEPYTPDWCTMTVQGLSQKYGVRIEKINTAVGGTVSEWGAEEAQVRGADTHPDLAILAFGMNDGSGWVATERYAENIRAIMNTIRSKNPSCEFVFVATMLPNREVAGFFGRQEEYLPVLLEMEEQGVCVADMTSLHRALLARKNYRDMTGNNVNHPNDFLARAYAQLLLTTLGV